MIKHPEEYVSSYCKGIKYIPDEVLEEYPIINIIELWYRYFLSLGIRLEFNPDNELFPYLIVVNYYGNGIYEIKFRLEGIKTEDKIKPQIIPSQIQYEIENILGFDEKSFIDCDPYMYEIYVSFNYEKTCLKRIRNQMIYKLKKKIQCKNLENAI